MVQVERRPKMRGGMGVKPRGADTISSGRTRRFKLQPHGYYDSAAEIVERDTSAPPALFRSKTRCTEAAEWMEIGELASQQAVWRIESRYGDRSVHMPDPASSRDMFISVLRMYRGYETKPQLLLVHRSESPEGMGGSGSSKDVEVYLCSDLAGGTADGDGMLNPDIDPDTELDFAMAGAKPLLPGGGRGDDEFTLGNLPEGEDVFTISCNETFTKIVLTSSLPEHEQSVQVGRRTLATLKRSIPTESRKMEVDAALDVSLVAALFSAVDQMMVSHDVIEYDVAWPQDYAYIMGGNCLTARKAERHPATFTNGEDVLLAASDKNRGCFGLF